MNIRDLIIGETYGVSSRIDSTYQNPWYCTAFKVKVLAVGKQTYAGSSGYRAYMARERKGATVKVLDSVTGNVRLPGMYHSVELKKGAELVISGRSIFCTGEEWDAEQERERKADEKRKAERKATDEKHGALRDRMDALGIGRWAKAEPYVYHFGKRIYGFDDWEKLVTALEKAREEDA